jgi:lysosomal acid lipase/cholesteryl ester hydrolase
MAFAALSQGQLLNMLRSAALLSPIAHMDQIPSKETKLGADLFLANVCERQKKNYTTLFS